MPKNTICLWYDKDAEDAARFYAATFPDSRVGDVHRAPGDYPSGKEGDALTVEFTVVGLSCIGLNGGPAFKHNEAFSFQIATDDQEETDRYWNAIVGNGGQESQCGWCKDKWGVSWQITPRVLTEAMAAGGRRGKARVRCDDGYEENRHRCDQGGAARLSFIDSRDRSPNRAAHIAFDQVARSPPLRSRQGRRLLPRPAPSLSADSAADRSGRAIGGCGQLISP